MNSIFAKRRARLLAMKAIRDNQTIPGEKTVTCPHCQQVSDRKIVAQGLSVCPKCGYHFPIGAYYRLSTILDPGSFRELNPKLAAGDPLHFPGYPEKLRAAQRKTGHGHHRRPQMCGRRAGQPVFHGLHERRRGREDHPVH